MGHAAGCDQDGFGSKGDHLAPEERAPGHRIFWPRIYSVAEAIDKGPQGSIAEKWPRLTSS